MRRTMRLGERYLSRRSPAPRAMTATRSDRVTTDGQADGRTVTGRDQSSEILAVHQLDQHIAPAIGELHRVRGDGEPCGSAKKPSFAAVMTSLAMACEDRLVAIVPQGHVARSLATCARCSRCAVAAAVGGIEDGPPAGSSRPPCSAPAASSTSPPARSSRGSAGPARPARGVSSVGWQARSRPRCRRRSRSG